MRLIKFTSIEQFRNVVFNIDRKYTFIGLDKNGDGLYDTSLPRPTLLFKGTVKLHGTNAGVCYNNTGLWTQSKESIITIGNDNEGFASFVEPNKDLFKELFEKIKTEYNIDLDKNTISIYGEWAGGSIQRGVAIANLVKSFFIFGVKVTSNNVVIDDQGNDRTKSKWYDFKYTSDLQKLECNDNRIYSITDYPTYEIEIDFNKPEDVIDKITELTISVEQECPVAKAFGFCGLGEGIVWICEYDGVIYRFKTKGDKHKSSNFKKIVSVDVDKLESIQSFVDYAVTESRFEQAIKIIFPNNELVDVKKLGDVITWILKDIVKEETDTLTENNLIIKDANKFISKKVRDMFLDIYRK